MTSERKKLDKILTIAMAVNVWIGQTSITKPLFKYIHNFTFLSLMVLWVVKLLTYTQKRSDEWYEQFSALTDFAEHFWWIEILFDYAFAPFCAALYFLYGFDSLYDGQLHTFIFVFDYFYLFILYICITDSWGHVYQTISLILQHMAKINAFAKYSKMDEQNMCAICHNSLNRSGNLVVMGCGHLFHSQCIHQYRMIALETQSRISHMNRCCLCQYDHHFTYLWSMDQLIQCRDKSLYQLVREIWTN
eukprot:207653_1